ncbi:hypothetical protein BOX15_Mlig018505g1 [Macrostomum lignano]|uniref:EGF-like domain-containing protein n=1 Tax=Macrostomum lignano TaxID=282301 RepID=A0A267GN09_9PLAT|nr:hypothetical protein BOX15_Mlig018505g1 [Macrostomum lignano]
MTTDKVRLKQLQQQQQQLQYRHPGGFGTLPIQHYHQQQQQQQQQPQFRQFQHPDSDVERRRRPSSLIADGAGNIAEADDDEDSEEEGDCPERRPFMLPESNSSTAAVGAAVRDRGVPMSVGRLYAAPPPVTAAAGGGIGVQQQLTLDSGVESGNLSMKQRGSPAGGLGYRELAASGSGSADSNSPQQQQQQQQLLQFTSTGQRGAKHPLPPPPHPQHSGVAFPIPPPPSEPPPCTPRNSALVGSGNGNSHYAESGSLFGQGFYGQTVGDTFYLPPGQLPPYHGTGGVVNNNTTSLMRHHPQLLDGMLLSCGGPDSRQGVYDTAGSLENRGKPLSPTVPGPSSSGHQQHSSGPDGGDSSAASKMLMYHPQYGSGSSTKKCHRKRLHCSSRCSIAVLCLFVLILLPAVIYFIFRTVKLERQVSENFAQNTSLFGLFNPNSPPVPIRDGEVYRAVLGPSAYWSGQLDCSRSFYLVLNVSLPPLQVAGLYLRRNSLPTVVQYDFFHRLVNLRRRTRKIAKRETQPQQPPLNQQSVIRFLTPGIWYVSLINDQPEPMVADISAELTLRDFQLPNCLNQCSNRGQCTDGRCSCLVGFKGPDCSIPDEVEICSGNGYFDRGRCHCHAQWKGAECEVAWSECLDPLCSGNGRCEAGSCRCFEGFSGDRCQNLSCGPSNCHGRGVCGPDGHCRCFAGWRGADCQTPAASANEANERCPADSDTAVRLCSGRGRIVDGRCECDRGFSGDSCEFETCLVTCQHGDCVNGSCQCHLGWSGVRCQLRSCGGTSSDSCSGHGVCVNGTCACDKGWNGPRCSLDGCPQSCSNNGNCELDPSTGDWRCVCVGLNLWHGDACQYPVEQQCSDSADNDNDGLVDCNDPDCCNQPVCSRAESCSPGAYPQQVLLSEPSLPYVSSFERRVRFLIGKESVQLYSSMYFEPRFISVVTGTLVFRDSTPALACRVWDGQNALIGNTLSRPDGSFYLVVVGGRSLSLNIARVMASGQTLTREIRLHVPANSFLHMGCILLSTAGSLAPAGSAYPQLYPTAAPSSLRASLDSASAQPRCRHNYALLQPRLLFGGAPGLESLSGNGGINTATVQLERGTLRVRVPLPGAPLSLVYISSRAIGYQTGMPMQLTGAEVPPGLAEVVCYVSVGGSMLRRRFEAGPNLTYHFEWDRLDAFSRPFTGLVEAKISVGYKYTGCSRVVWEHRAVLVSGMELAPAQLGQWSLDRVHAYDYNKGVLHRGDGATEYLSQRPWTSSTVAGTGARRDPLTCPIPADSSSSPQPACQRSLQSPVALAAAPDGSLIIGDGRYLRILQWLSGSDSDSEAGGRRSDQLKTLAELPTGFETATYHLACDASRSHGSLAVYISDPTSRQLWLVLQRRPERPRRILLAGSGEPCYADDADDCGDGGPAASARLSSPKGVAVDRRGVVYFADGASIRRLVPTTSNSAVEDGAIVETVAGHRRGGFAANDEPPLPCGRVTIRARDLRLRWPTSLAYNQVDDCVYFIEDRSVLRLTADGFAHIVAGRPPHCSATVAKADSQRPLARDDILRRPRAIAFSALGELLIAETVDNGDGGSSGSVRVLRADGRLHRLTGHQPASGSFKSVSALAVSPLGEVFLADPASWLVSRMFYELPRPSPIDGSFQVLSADGSELFTFSKDGKHLSTWTR